MLTGKILKKIWNVEAKHALYSKDGKWYHQLTNFPGALFDPNGYILFKTEQDYRKCSGLKITKDLHATEGISAISGYIRITEGNNLQDFSIKLRQAVEQHQNDSVQPASRAGQESLITPKAYDLPEAELEVTRALVQVYRIIRDTEIARRVKFIHHYRCQICNETIDLGNGKYYAESHHIKPLGSKHNGPDVIENIICVCPNHHALLDYGAIEIDNTNLRIVEEHKVSKVYISYHNTVIYKQNT